MGKTWTRRPHRRVTEHGLQAHKLIPLRMCCDSTSRGPHRRDCVREPSACGDKHPFDSRSEARRHVLAMVAKTDLGWREYECPSCGLWHLSTSL